MKKNILKQFKENSELEVGIDEAGRGCLFGPVCIASVIWLDEDPDPSIVIKDSKKCSQKHRLKSYDYIKKDYGNTICRCCFSSHFVKFSTCCNELSTNAAFILW